ncbi:Oidioi.mRNA.OKI2018_I69.chr2.g4844.t1.cds [Oikopleura dioica]|uniref:Oidioi.mRNA.OKI2018_I69.chr2.g4844.t1.cds n=1 Tax=Oikopleura dioica TaxID=34765 RepID=A0ABN7SY76_OIKDI|nr:Oidioi.mRNA.OKI2018_I69.chr2.g4844.t1.cds [Oikopleura dioica]
MSEQEVSQLSAEISSNLNVSSPPEQEPKSQVQPPVLQVAANADLNNNPAAEPQKPIQNLEAAVLQPQINQPSMGSVGQMQQLQNTPVASDKIWCRFLIPSKVAGAIIGRGGATIRALREEFQAIINIPEARAPERVLKICVNSREKLHTIVAQIADILKNENAKGSHNGRRKEGETELRILVQSSQAGAIIGTKGSTVKNLRETTGSRININPECCPNSSERVAAIMGPPATVVKCISMIYDILERVPAKGNEQRYDPNMFDPTYDYGGYGFDPRHSNEQFIPYTRPPYPYGMPNERFMHQPGPYGNSPPFYPQNFVSPGRFPGPPQQGAPPQQDFSPQRHNQQQQNQPRQPSGPPPTQSFGQGGHRGGGHQGGGPRPFRGGPR